MMSCKLQVMVRGKLGLTLFLRLFFWTLGLSVLLAGVLLAGHYFITLQHLPCGVVCLRLLYLLLPRIMTYALPLALFSAVGIVYDGLILSRESIVLVYFARAQRAWRSSVAAVTLCVAAPFIACVGWLGPVWYRAAKQEMVASVVRLVKGLPPRTVCRVSSQLSVYCDDKESSEWRDVRLCLTEKENRIVISAERAQLEKTTFMLHDGSIAHWSPDSVTYHQFGTLRLPLATKIGVKAVPTKYKTISELWREKLWKELVHRGVQVLLLLVLVWLMLFFLSRVPGLGRSRLVQIIALAVGLLAIMQIISVLI